MVRGLVLKENTCCWGGVLSLGNCVPSGGRLKGKVAWMFRVGLWVFVGVMNDAERNCRVIKDSARSAYPGGQQQKNGIEKRMEGMRSDCLDRLGFALLLLSWLIRYVHRRTLKKQENTKWNTLRRGSKQRGGGFECTCGPEEKSSGPPTIHEKEFCHRRIKLHWVVQRCKKWRRINCIIICPKG